MGIGFSASWKISLVTVATFPISIAAAALQMQTLAGQQYDTDVGKGGAGGIINSAFTNIRTVSAFSMQHKVGYKRFLIFSHVNCIDKGSVQLDDASRV